MRRITLKFLLGFLVTSIVLVIVLVAFAISIKKRSNQMWALAEDHLVAHQEALIADAKDIIETPRTEVKLSDLPPSLALPNLQHAEVTEDHLNLILYTSPDTTSGFRVWIVPPTDGFDDRSTAIPFVFRYSYCDDFPIATNNRP